VKEVPLGGGVPMTILNILTVNFRKTTVLGIDFDWTCFFLRRKLH